MEAYNIKSEEVYWDTLNKLSYEKKLVLSETAYLTAWNVKLSALKALHPEWNEEKINIEVRRAFIGARS